MENENGFYKYDLDSGFFYAPNFVYGPNYELRSEIKDDYVYPVEGWIWFNSVEEAYNHYGLDYAQYLLDKEAV